MPYRLATPAILRHYFIINKVGDALENFYRYIGSPKVKFAKFRRNLELVSVISGSTIKGYAFSEAFLPSPQSVGSPYGYYRLSSNRSTASSPLHFSQNLFPAIPLR